MATLRSISFPAGRDPRMVAPFVGLGNAATRLVEPIERPPFFERPARLESRHCRGSGRGGQRGSADRSPSMAILDPNAGSPAPLVEAR